MLLQMNSFQMKNERITNKNIVKSFDGKNVLENISASIQEGEFVSFVGIEWLREKHIIKHGCKC